MTKVHVKRRKEAGQTIILAAVSLATLLVAAGLRRSTWGTCATNGATRNPPLIAPPLLEQPTGLSGRRRRRCCRESRRLHKWIRRRFKRHHRHGQQSSYEFDCWDPYQNNAGAVEVIVSQNQPTFFMKIVGRTSVPVSAQAVATLGSSKGCIYALGAAGVTYTAASNISASCGVIDNGD